MSIILGLLPIIVVFLMLAVLRRPADLSGLVGWGAIVLIAWLYFHTAWNVLLTVSWAGIIASFPISLMVVTSLLQITYMQKVGAISRLVVFLKALSPQDKVVQILLINVGFGTLMTALGATPVSILPPIMLALGYSTFVSIALPAIGYDALCTYALLGVPIVIFSQFTGIGVHEAGAFFARYMPVISTLIAFGMLYIVGKWRMMWKGFLPTIITGLTAGGTAILMNWAKLTLLTGVGAGLAVILIMLVYLKIRGRRIYDLSVLSTEDRQVQKTMSLWRAVVPWLILIFFAVLTNLPGPIFDYLFKTLSMPVAVIPVDKPLAIRFFWQAYWWLLVSTLLAIPFYKKGFSRLKETFATWVKRAPRPAFSAAIFFAIAYVMNFSGYNSGWELPNPDLNIVAVLANGSARVFGQLYGLVSPYLGMLAGFLSGSESSAIAMLTKFHLQTAQMLWENDLGRALIVAAASGIGGGLASVISPAKLQNAAAAIDRIGEEGKVIRVTFVIALAITLACAVMTFLWTW